MPTKAAVSTLLMGVQVADPDLEVDRPGRALVHLDRLFGRRKARVPGMDRPSARRNVAQVPSPILGCNGEGATSDVDEGLGSGVVEQEDGQRSTGPRRQRGLLT